MRSYCTHLSSLIVLCSLAFMGLQAQETSISPYSRYGIGDLDQGNFVGNFGMGGTGVGIVDGLHINPLNPASLSFLGFPTFEVGTTGDYGTISSSDQSVTRKNFRLNHFAVGFPMDKGKMGAAFGLTPYSTIGHSGSTETYLPDLDITQVSEFTGNGGLNRLFLDVARSFVVKSDSSKYSQHSSVSVGGEFNYLFGSLSTQRNSIFPANNGYMNTRVDKATTLNDVSFGISTMARHYLNKKENDDDKKFTVLNVGAVLDIGGNLSGRKTQDVYTYSQNVSEVVTFKDSVNSFNNLKGFITLPTTISVGASVDFFFLPENAKNLHKMTVALDYKTADWSALTEDFGSEKDFLQMGKLATVHAGVSYQPDANLRTGSRVSSFSIATYRLGYHTGNTHLLIANQAITETGMSFGLSLPVLAGGLNRTNTQLDLGVEYMTRGSVENGLLEETFWKFMVGFSFHPYARFDKWFQRRKYD
jgi:hypothetical protein